MTEPDYKAAALEMAKAWRALRRMLPEMGWTQGTVGMHAMNLLDKLANELDKCPHCNGTGKVND